MTEKPRHRFTELQLKLVLLEQHAADYFVIGVNHLLQRELSSREGYLANGVVPSDPQDLARYHRTHLWHGAHLHAPEARGLERLEAADGSFDVQSIRGGGTRVTATVPAHIAQRRDTLRVYASSVLALPQRSEKHLG